MVNTWSEQQLHKLFEQYGEVTNAKTLARTIVAVRRSVSLKTISNFKAALTPVVKGNPNKYFARVFQALRIEVNDELGALKEMLLQTTGLLSPWKTGSSRISLKKELSKTKTPGIPSDKPQKPPC